MSLAPIFAQINDDAVRALRRAGLADVAAVQDEPMMSILAVFGRDEFRELVLHDAHRLARCNTCAVGDPEDVRVDRNFGVPEGRVEDHAGGFAADARQRFQLGTCRRHLTAMPFDERLAGGNDVFGLGILKADGFDE